MTVGSRVLVRRDINLCTALELRDAVGVFLRSSRANQGSLFSLRTFLNKDLATFTATSTFPFDM